MREDRRRRYDDGFRREALEPVKAGSRQGTRSPRHGLPYRCIPRETGSGCTGPAAREAVMGGNGGRRYDWGDEGRSRARPRRERHDQDRGHGEVRDREHRAVGTLVPRIPGGRPEALRPKPKGRPRGSKSKPKPEPTREQKLAEQVAYLKAKVAYWKNSGSCGRRSHETREKRRRPTARRADTAVACGLQIWLWPVLFIDVFSWRFYDDCLQG